jgi:hypothetical protein
MCVGNGNSTLPIDLDRSFFVSPETALAHVRELTEKEGTTTYWIIPQNDVEKKCPIIMDSFEFMCCPRCIKEPLSKLSIGYIDSSVRKIINAAQFPVLIPSPVFRPWKRIAVFYGGSDSALNAVKLGLQISRVSGLPMDIFTQVEKGVNENIQNIVENHIHEAINKWHLFKCGDFISNIYNVPHDALVVMGGFHSKKCRNYSSKMEKIQSVLPNNLLAVGPNYSKLILPGPNTTDLPSCAIQDTRNLGINHYR